MTILACIAIMAVCVIVGAWAYANSERERADFADATSNLGHALDDALGLSRLLGWLNTKLER